MQRNLTLLIVAIFLFGATGCNRKEAVPAQLLTVKTEAVKSESDPFELIYPGKTQAPSDISLAFRIAGPISRVPVEVGQFVRKGSVLAELDPRDYRLQLEATKAEYEKIKAEAERVIELYQRGSATNNDYDKARYGLEQITGKYEAHRNALEDVVLRAPSDGYVQKKYFKAGEMVNAGTPVISFIGQGDAELVIHIPATDYLRKERFENYTASCEAYPGRSFPLELTGITPRANLNQLYETRFRVKPVEGVKPTPGMSMNVTIRFRPEEDALVTIPLSALFENGGKPAVWIYDEQTQTVTSRQIRPVQIRKEGTVVVGEGLRAHEIVVTAGTRSLSEGMKVRRLAPVSETNVGGLL